MKRKIIPYNPKLTALAKELRNNSTRTEIKLWNSLKRKQFYGYDFHRQKPLLAYIADFYCYELALVIEVDGYSHQLEETYLKDVKKQQALEAVGLSVLRFTDDEVWNEFDSVLYRIEDFILKFEERADER